jgi:uncharacterized protein with PIN domain
MDTGKNGQSSEIGPQQGELFPQRDRCPICGGRLIAKTDGFGKAYEYCRKCKRRTFLQA